MEPAHRPPLCQPTKLLWIILEHASAYKINLDHPWTCYCLQYYSGSSPHMLLLVSAPWIKVLFIRKSPSMCSEEENSHSRTVTLTFTSGRSLKLIPNWAIALLWRLIPNQETITLTAHPQRATTVWRFDWWKIMHENVYFRKLMKVCVLWLPRYFRYSI